jgi:ABC-2 type transport system ATP-binding protein
VSIVSIHNISKNFRSIQALNNVSFDVPEGSVFGVLGPNGSGKTTLLSILMEVLYPASGTFQLFMQPPSNDCEKKLGRLLETPNFYHYLSELIISKLSQALKEADMMILKRY